MVVIFCEIWMPFLLLIIGFMAVVSALKGTYTQLGQELVTDLQGSVGSTGYIYWVSSIVAIGAIGYYTPAQRFSRAFMILILVGMVLSNQGLFAKIQAALKQPASAAGNTTPTTVGSLTSTLTGGATSLATGQAALTVAEATIV
jgi:hypothetical protein